MLKQRSKEMIDFLHEDRRLLNSLGEILSNSNMAVFAVGDKVDELRNLFDHYEDDECQRLYLMDFMFE